MKCKQSNNFIIIAGLIALANLAFFGLMFTLMNYFELMGADKSYFDDGSVNNINIINTILALLGQKLDPMSQEKISTLQYSLAYGVALIVSGLSIFIACRKPSEDYEVSDAV